MDMHIPSSGFGQLYFLHPEHIPYTFTEKQSFSQQPETLVQPVNLIRQRSIRLFHR